MAALSILLEEHKLLLKAIGTTKKIQQIVDDNTYYDLLHDVILFFRDFTEIYHHPKEENILYPLLKNKSEKMNPEFLHEICDNHEDFKSLMAEIENAYVAFDHRTLRTTMGNYISTMEEHIKKENTIILSVVKDLLNKQELENVSKAFENLDKKYGDKENLMKSFHRINYNLSKEF